MPTNSASRTNLTSHDVRISNRELGRGTFRVCFEGTFLGGNRNQQKAACKRFHPQFRRMENEYLAADFQIADRAIDYAEDWNQFCPVKKEITISRGMVVKSNSGLNYLVEPYIRDFEKFTSNSGWIADVSGTMAMEAFSHFTYHRSGGSLLVCDIQGRYRQDPHGRGRKNKSRYELSDPAICSRKRLYGPTDLGEKGIESFFANHVCNHLCHSNGERWQRPRNASNWFQASSATSMFSSHMDPQLRLTSGATFSLGLNNIMEEDCDSDSDDSDDDYW